MRGLLIAMLITVAVVGIIVMVQIDSSHNQAIQSACEIAKDNVRKGILVTPPSICNF